MKGKGHTWLLMPLTPAERADAERIAQLVAGEIGGCGPAKKAEVAAHLIAQLLHDHGMPTDDDNLEAAQRLLTHLLHRVHAIGEDLTRRMRELTTKTK